MLETAPESKFKPGSILARLEGITQSRGQADIIYGIRDLDQAEIPAFLKEYAVYAHNELPEKNPEELRDTIRQNVSHVIGIDGMNGPEGNIWREHIHELEIAA